MGWEERRGNRYYYRSVREGDHVRKVYVGGGVLGEIAAREDEYNRQRREEEALCWKKEREQLEALIAPMEEFDEAVEILAHAAFLASGYHRHKGEWRRKREPKSHR